jgi:predicted dehydrogenase
VYSSRLNLGRVRQEENILFSFAPHDISIIEYVLGAEPTAVSSTGGSYVQEGIADVTVTNLEFAGDVRGHIFVSWLHPYREKKLVVIGDKKMAVFDDMAPASGPGSKLTLYDKGIDWTPDGRPIPRHSGDTPVPIDPAEPMRIECRAFLTSIRDRTQPLTDGRSGLAVQKVLEAARRSLELGGTRVLLSEIEETPVDA